MVEGTKIILPPIKPVETKGKSISRRDFLKAGAAVAALTVAAAGCTKLPTTATPTTPSPTPTQSPPTTSPSGSPVFAALQFFSRPQAEIVHAAAGRIIPGTPDDPGAKEAGVVVFIDQALDGYDSALQRDYWIAIDGMEKYARGKYNKGFVELTDAELDGILTNMQGNTDEAKNYLPNPGGFFSTFLTHVRQGMFCDPVYEGNRDAVGWKLIGHPGIVFGRDPAQQKCDIDFPREFMGAEEYYATHPS